MDKNINGRTVLRGINRMTKRQRREIADWLRGLADAVMNDGELFAQVFTAKHYMKDRDNG